MKNDAILSHHLARRIFGQLGARPDLVGKISACHDDNRCGTIRVEEEDYGSVVQRELPIWKATIHSDLVYKILVVDFGTVEEPEFITILAGYSLMNEENPENIYGVHFTWEEDDEGKWFTMIETDWYPMSLHQKMLLGAWVEAYTQFGAQWVPCHDGRNQLDDMLRKFLVYI